jgi:cytochrome c
MSGDLKWNKILGAGLATAFVIILVQQGTNILFAQHAPEKMGYFVDAPEDAVAGAEAPVLPPDWGTVFPTADVAAGQAAFARCQACHTDSSGGPNGIGPNLWGVLGRPVASHAGFAYSDAMKAHAGELPSWTLDGLYEFINSPQKVVPGTKMSFAGIRDSQTRINLIAYLRTQGSTGFAIPAPDPSRQPGAAIPAEGAAETPTAPGAAEAAAPNGGQTGAAPTTGAAGQSTTQAAPAAPSAATSAPGSPR